MSTLVRLKSFLREQQFDPGPLGILVNPFYFARKGLRDGIGSLAGELQGRLLDVGCGQKPYEKYFPVTQYVGLEYVRGQIVDNDKADFYYSGDRFPFKDHEFDCVLTNEVLEHVFTPSKFLGETNRVIRPGGMLLLTVPFLWAEHMQPFDYARYSSFGIKALLEEHGFEILRHERSMNDIRALCQLINLYIYRATESRNGKLNLIACLMFMAPVNIIGEIFSWVTPRTNEMYLDNIILARKVRDV